MQLMQYVYSWQAHRLTLQALHTYLLFFVPPGALLTSLLGVEVGVVQERHVSLCLWTLSCTLGGGQVEGLADEVHQAVRESRCCAQGRMRSMATSARNVHLQSEGWPAD